MRLLRTKKNKEITVVVDGITLEGKPLSLRRRTRIQADHTKKKSKGGRLEETTDWAEVNADYFDETVSDWNAKDEELNELPCDSETKRLVANLNPGWAQDVIDAFDNAGSEVEPDETKKGKASSSAG